MTIPMVNEFIYLTRALAGPIHQPPRPPSPFIPGHDCDRQG